MNTELIERLSKEALKELHTDKEGTLLLTPVFDKLVELIVGECIEVFSKDLPEEGDGKMLEVINRVCNVAEHFGVKNEQT